MEGGRGQGRVLPSPGSVRDNCLGPALWQYGLVGRAEFVMTSDSLFQPWGPGDSDHIQQAVKDSSVERSICHVGVQG